MAFPPIVPSEELNKRRFQSENLIPPAGPQFITVPEPISVVLGQIGVELRAHRHHVRPLFQRRNVLFFDVSASKSVERRVYSQHTASSASGTLFWYCVQASHDSNPSTFGKLAAPTVPRLE
jgi:hypothetical protein